MVTLYLTLLVISKLFSKASVPYYIMTSSVWGFQFSTSLPMLAQFCLLDYNYHNGWEVVSHFDFDLHSPNDFPLCWETLMCLLDTFISFWRNLYSNLYLFKIAFCVFYYLYIVDIVPYQIYGFWVFFPFCTLPFHCIDGIFAAQTCLIFM